MAQDTNKIKIDIKAPSYTLDLGQGNLWEKAGLNSNTILQSFAMDYKDKNIYIAQCRTGATNPDYGATQGDIDINKVGYNGERKSIIRCVHNDGWDNKSSLQYNDEFNEYNYVKNNVRGFGHGTQIGIEYAPDGKYLWLDYDSPCVDRVKDKSEGITDYYVVGERLARIPLTDNATYKYGDSKLRTFTLTARIKDLVKSDFATVSLDSINGLLAVKYTDNNNVMQVTIFKMTYNDNYINTHYMSDIEFTELKTFKSPYIKWPKASITGNGKKIFGNLIPNGWVIFGDYVYFMCGTAYWAKTTQEGQTEWYSPTPKMVEEGCYRYNIDGTYVKETKVGNTHLICVNWKTGEEKIFHTEAAKSLAPFREPEGMNVIPTLDSKGNITNLKLVMGFANGVPGDRNWTMMYKENDNIPY